MSVQAVVPWGVTGGAVILVLLIEFAVVLACDARGVFERLDRKWRFGRTAAEVTGFVWAVGFVIPVIHGRGWLDSTAVGVASALAMIGGGLLLGRAVDNVRPFLDLRSAPGPDIGAVEPGRVAVSGTVQTDERVVEAPFSGTVVACCSIRVLESVSSGQGYGLEVVHEGQFGRPFELVDATGRIEVDPSKATLELNRDFRSEVGSADDVTEPVRAYLSERGVEETDGRRIFTESRLEPESVATVVGEATRTDAGNLVVDGGSAFVITEGDVDSTAARYRLYVTVGGAIGVALTIGGFVGLLVTIG